MWSLPKIVGVVVLALLLLGGSGILIAYWYYNQTVNYAPNPASTPQTIVATPSPSPQAQIIGSVRQDSNKVIEYTSSGYKPNYVYTYITDGGSVFAAAKAPTLITINGIGEMTAVFANLGEITSKSLRIGYGNGHFTLQNPYQILFINYQINLNPGDYAIYGEDHSNKLEIYVFSGQITVAGQTFSDHQLVTITQTSIATTKNAPTPSWAL